jgi:nicotinamidase-related amidase
MDLQVGIVDLAPNKAALLRNAVKALRAARGAGMTVVHVGVGFRNGYPEVHANNTMFSGLKANRALQAEPQHPEVAPVADEVLVIKRRVSSFHATDLDMILRANGIDTLYLSGFATSGVVLSTVRAAADADYQINVLEDCCDDFNADVQKTLMSQVFPMQATVLTSDAYASALAAAA